MTIRCRTSCCRRSAAAARCAATAAGASAIATRCSLSGEWRWIPESHGARHGVLLRHRHGRAPPRCDHAGLVRQRLRRRRAVSRAGAHAAARRARARVAKACGSCSPRARRSDHDHTTATRVATRRCAACWPPARRCSPAPSAASSTTIRWRASPTRRMPSKVSEWEIDLIDRSRDQPVRPARATRRRRARAERQHHRRGAGFELVHQPHPGAAADARRGVARPAHRQRAGAGPVDRRVAEAGRLRAGVHDARLARRSLVRVVRRRRSSRSGHRRDHRRQQDLLGARLLAGREPSGHRHAGPARHRRQGDVHAGVRTQAPDGAARSRRRLRARASQRRRQLSRRRRARRARPSDRRVPLLRHASRRSERRRARTSTAASCAR